MAKRFILKSEKNKQRPASDGIDKFGNKVKSGAGDDGTIDLVRSYARMTPGQEHVPRLVETIKLKLSFTGTKK